MTGVDFLGIWLLSSIVSLVIGFFLTMNYRKEFTVKDLVFWMFLSLLGGPITAMSVVGMSIGVFIGEMLSFSPEDTSKVLFKRK